MNITILSRNKNLYSTNRLFNAGTKRGHDIMIVDYMRCYVNIGQNQSAIYYDGKKLKYPEIKLIYWAGGNPFHHHQDLNIQLRLRANRCTVLLYQQ